MVAHAWLTNVCPSPCMHTDGLIVPPCPLIRSATCLLQEPERHQHAGNRHAGLGRGPRHVLRHKAGSAVHQTARRVHQPCGGVCGRLAGDAGNGHRTRPPVTRPSPGAATFSNTLCGALACQPRSPLTVSFGPPSSSPLASTRTGRRHSTAWRSAGARGSCWGCRLCVGVHSWRGVGSQRGQRAHPIADTIGRVHRAKATTKTPPTLDHHLPRCGGQARCTAAARHLRRVRGGSADVWLPAGLLAWCT